MMFIGKVGKQTLVETMKKKYGLVNKSCSYAITRIFDPVVKVATQILIRKVTRKRHSDEVTAPITALVAQCMDGV